ncbi:zymogen granule protein 16 homolog B [Cervus elaphus]|uniref:zymogen granule protein 16 homolog B n=1 Tax=Cervus elaphus TaxID=9860 RepID=UPI001CC30C17|nr:zymogen granule protein 16 homolog B [Cervus elaphus]
MLLWLTLALLWSPTCWAQQIFGPGGGDYFSTSRDFQNNVTRIFSVYGSFSLYQKKSEQITGVLGSFRHFLSYLAVHTNLWPPFHSGCPRGHFFIASPDDSQKELTGVYGQHTVQGIASISFDWDYPSD